MEAPIPFQRQQLGNAADAPAVLCDAVAISGVIPAVVVPGHGVDGVVTGAGSVIIGLTPRLLSSVAPNGIVAVPGNAGVTVESGDAVPAGDTFEEDPGVQFVEANPPPSKEEAEGDVPLIDEEVPGIADVPTGMPPVVEGALVVIVEQGTGLNPPGSISVAPSGIPVSPVRGAAEEPRVPIGDVAPSPGAVGMPVVEMLWACAIVQFRKIVAAKKTNGRMDASLRAW